MKAPIYPPRAVVNHFAKHAQVSSILLAGTPSSSPPALSILIPTYRRPGMLREAIASALNQQGFDDYEVIVADNDAGDAGDLRALIAEFGSDKLVYYKHAENLGMAGNWNRCIELARGRWISLLHDDDWVAPTFLARMFARLPGDAVLMTCDAPLGDLGYAPEFLGSLTTPRDPPLRQFTLARLIAATVASSPGIIFLKQSAVQLGGFDEQWWPCADYDFYIRMSFSGPCYLLPEPLAYYRTTDSATFKNDTFIRMTSMTARISHALVASAPTPFHYAVYVEAMRRWLSGAARAGLVGAHIDAGAVNGIVKILTGIGPLAAPFGKLIGAAKRLPFLRVYPHRIAGECSA